MKKTILVLICMLYAVTLFADDTVMIQVRFKEQTEVGQYNDALYYTQAEYAAVKQKDIDAEKQRRITNWIDRVKNAPLPIEPTIEDLRSELGMKKKDIEDLASRLRGKGVDFNIVIEEITE